MAESQKNLPHVSVDGKWFPCLPANDFGFLGERFMCVLQDAGGVQEKKLLLRKAGPALAGGASGNELDVERMANGADLGLRAVVRKTYQSAVPGSDGKLTKKEISVIQQDVTGLTSLQEALAATVNEGQPKKVWKLFNAACKSLNDYGKKTGNPQSVLLQCPSSLAVDSRTGTIVPLDAEVRASALSIEDVDTIVRWFGAAGRARYASAENAPILHSKAVLRYFRELLGHFRPQKGSPGPAIVPKLMAQLDQIPATCSLQELQERVKRYGEDWSVPVADEAVRPPVGAHRASGVQLIAAADPTPHRRRSWLLAFLLSCFVNALLVLALLLLGLWSGLNRPKAVAANAGNEPVQAVEIPAKVVQKPPTDSTLKYSSFCVVFPTQGTSRQKVHQAVQQLFPDRVIDPNGGEELRSRLLKEHLAQTVQAIKDQEGLQKLLAALADESMIRFKGHSTEKTDSGISTIVERGGLFAIAAKGEKKVYGSLLQADGLKVVLAYSGMGKKVEDQRHLEALGKATAEYASLKDAIMVMGDRSAYILRVEPTAQGHETVRKQLLGKAGTPVFVPRPALDLFDAVDPSADTGGGVAKYSLKLDQRCYWRQVGLDDRAKVDFAGNPTNNKMQWTAFPPLQAIVWAPIGVLKKNGRTDSVSTFDIAVVVNAEKVVVFRNQSIMVGESRDEVLTQAKTYLERVLKLRNQPTEEAVSVASKLNQFTATLQYSFLAEQTPSAVDREDLAVMTQQQFDVNREAEDKMVK